MPIISRTLESVQQTGDSVLASWLAIDGKGREWRRSRMRFASRAAAQAALDAFDWRPELRDREESDAVEFVRAGGNPNSFAFTELTAKQLRRRLIKRFMRQPLGEDRDFTLRQAQWVALKTVAQLVTILGVSQAVAQRILDRATVLAGLKSTLEDDDGKREKL